MMERRVKGAKKVAKPGVSEGGVAIKTKEKKTKEKPTSATITLDRWFKTKS